MLVQASTIDSEGSSTKHNAVVPHQPSHRNTGRRYQSNTHRCETQSKVFTKSNQAYMKSNLVLRRAHAHPQSKSNRDRTKSRTKSRACRAQHRVVLCCLIGLAPKTHAPPSTTKATTSFPRSKEQSFPTVMGVCPLTLYHFPRSKGNEGNACAVSV